jgi:hypothetical protein
LPNDCVHLVGQPEIDRRSGLPERLCLSLVRLFTR